MKYPKLKKLENDLFFPDYSQNISHKFSDELHRFFNSEKSLIGNTEIDYSDKQTLIFLVIDGLGKELKYSSKFVKCFKQGGEWISSTYPSITPTALSSIFTGLPPSNHGITGHLLPSFNTKSFFQIAKDKNMNWLDYDFTNNNGPFLRSGNLTQMKEPKFFILGPPNPLHPSYGIVPMLFGKQIHSYMTFNHLQSQIRRIMTNCPDKKVVIVYSMTYDIISHLTGKRNFLARQEINKWSSMLTKFLSSLEEKDRREMSIIISADHGHKEVTSDIRLTGAKKDYIDSHVTGVGNSGRVLHFYPITGYRDKIKHILESEWDQYGLVITDKTIKELIGSNPDSLSVQRIGELNFVPYASYSTSWDSKYAWFNDIIKFPNKFLTTTEHGGLTKDELLTPFFLFE